MSLDTEQSLYREQLLEHLLLGELLSHSWLHDSASLEISQPAIDRAGHDVVLEAHRITRHVQLKSSAIGSKTARQTIHLALCEKPSGCVVWVQFDRATLKLGPFWFLGGAPGKRLEDIGGLPVAKHAKGNAKGIKLERPNLRIVNRGKFTRVESIQELYRALFGVG